MISAGFFWKVLVALIKAAIHLKAHDIIHTNLTPEYISLVPEFDVKEMGGWGLKPDISDFFLARPILFEHNDLVNPDDFEPLSATSFRAPEQHITDPPIFPAGTKIDEKTAVFQIGCFFHSLVHRKVPRVLPIGTDENEDASVWRSRNVATERPTEEEPGKDIGFLKEWLFDTENNKPEFNWKAFDEYYHYDPYFWGIMIRCLRFDPRKRPTLETLLASVLKIDRKVKDKPTKEKLNLVHSKKRKYPDEEAGAVFDRKRSRKREENRRTGVMNLLHGKT